MCSLGEEWLTRRLVTKKTDIDIPNDDCEGDLIKYYLFLACIWSRSTKTGLIRSWSKTISREANVYLKPRRFWSRWLGIRDIHTLTRHKRGIWFGVCEANLFGPCSREIQQLTCMPCFGLPSNDQLVKVRTWLHGHCMFVFGCILLKMLC